jgi:tRNA (cytidine/uridine-2'-O-)-methyltransferase
VALYEPEIPPNAGNIARLCAATGAELHLIGRLGFSLQHPDAQRAGMDYWRQVALHRHINHADFRAANAGRRIWMLTTRTARSLWDVRFRTDDVLLLGPESKGLPDALLAADPDHTLRIPMLPDARSLNLASSAAIALYEALRQVHRHSSDG